MKCVHVDDVSTFWWPETVEEGVEEDPWIHEGVSIEPE